MKIKFFSTVILLISSLLLNAQITTDPEFPTAEQPVTIYFDATGTGLEGYSGDVYAHTGVDLSNGSQWQHVIGSWGDNNTQPKLTHISGNLYKLDITPSVNDFYSVGSSETVVGIDFVFRSADANSQTSDLFVEIYQETTNATFALPDTSNIFSISDSVDIQVVALFADSIKLFVSDTFFVATDTNILSTKVFAATAGKTILKAIAFDETDTVEVNSFFFVRANNNVAELPENCIDGINYIDSTTVTLVLYAPYKNFVFVKGDFNNWQIDLNYQMNITPDSCRYWLTISNLTPKKEYAFQYFVDADFSIADPYADKILDPWNDTYIPSSTYPDLMSYPTGKAEGIVSVLQTSQTPYSWQVETFQRPDKQDLVIYELLVRDFTNEQNFQAVIDTLSYLKGLGINAIELMPVNEFEGNLSWGYNPDFYFAVDKYYGTKNKFKELIDVCHQNGIAVIMDIVLNHSYGQSPLVQLYLNRETWQVTSQNPWYNVTSPNPDYSWGYDFNHESSQTRDFVDRVLNYWLTEYKIDGYRFDFSKGFTNTQGNGWNYDQSRIDILKHYADTIWATSPSAYLILEHFTDNAEEKVLANYGMMIWGNINYQYSQAAMGYNEGSDFSWISYKERNWTNSNLVGYMESHDEERMMYRNLTYGASSGTYDIKNLETALQRVKLAATFFFTVPGPKMIWQFEELGYDISIDDPCRTCEKPVHWDYLLVEERKNLCDFIANLIDLKKNYSIFKTDDFTMNTQDDVKEIILRSDTNMIIIGNFGVESAYFTPDFTHSGTWYEYFSGGQLSDISTKILLQPGEYRIYTDAKLPLPDFSAPPQANNIIISGEPLINATLTASYDYFDANGDIETGSVYQWYRSDYASGAYPKPILNADSLSYTLSTDDLDKYIIFEVTPKTETGGLTMGMPVMSDVVGPVDFAVSDIEIYPNPSSGIINFINIAEYDQIIVTDLNGRMIDKFDINAKKIITKDYSFLREGVYIVKMISETDVIKLKFVKM